MKLLILVGITIGGIVGSVIGRKLDHTGFGGWSILLSGAGSFAGLWAGYKLGHDYLEL
jgi:hypothetical protein